MEEINWIQNSKSKFIKEGQNMKYFHSLANWSRRKNFMKSISINGEFDTFGNMSSIFINIISAQFQKTLAKIIH